MYKALSNGAQDYNDILIEPRTRSKAKGEIIRAEVGKEWFEERRRRDYAPPCTTTTQKCKRYPHLRPRQSEHTRRPFGNKRPTESTPRRREQDLRQRKTHREHPKQINRHLLWRSRGRREGAYRTTSTSASTSRGPTRRNYKVQPPSDALLDGGQQQRPNHGNLLVDTRAGDGQEVGRITGYLHDGKLRHQLGASHEKKM